MIVSLTEVLKGETTYEVCYGTSWWAREDEYDPVIRLSMPISAHIEIEPAGNRFFLTGKVKTELVLRCDRCLEEFYCPMEQSFSLVIKRADPVLEVDKELKKEELLEEVVKGEELDLDPIIREQIYLFLPMKCLCNENCRGICPNCGKNLNFDQCTCKKEAAHPAFQVLTRLKGGNI